MGRKVVPSAKTRNDASSPVMNSSMTSLAAGGTHGTNFHEIVHGGTRLLESLRDNNTLSGCKAVGLHHDGQASVLEPEVCLLRRGAFPKGGGRNPIGLEESLRVSLAGLQSGIRSVGADNLQTSLTKHIDDAKAERNFRTDERQIDLLLLRKIQKFPIVFRRNRNQPSLTGNATISGSGIDLPNLWISRKSIDDRVLAAAGSDDENFHLGET